MKQLFLYLSILLTFTSCRENQKHKRHLEDSEISKRVNTLYTTYGKSNEAIYNLPIQKGLFTLDLERLIEKVISISKDDIENVKKSSHPTDKPLILEGAIFSSLYEGYSNYTIKAIDINEDTAIVTIAFENDRVSPKIMWTDKVYLINSIQRGWLIDNIKFDPSVGTATDLKTSLNDFIKQ